MIATELADSTKILNQTNRYFELIINKKELINSSKSIVRKKRSPLARKIDSGDVNAILRASKSRLYGSISKEKREELCKLLCKIKNELKEKVKNKKGREFILTAISALVGLADFASGLMIPLLWILRENISDIICKCKLNSDCLTGSCAGTI